MKLKTFLVLLIVLTIPSFFRMLRPGIYSTQDFHLFRLIEFDKCIGDLQIPCRWVPDAGLGYGEPLFNFYGQLPYALGEVFHLVGISQIDSLKILFIISFVASGISMFFLSRQIWKNNFSAILSSIFYIYAPYRAVDVWVRGALPESLAFVIFPLIFLKINSFFENNKISDLIWLSLLIAILVTTHNLSLLLILPTVFLWVLYKLYTTNKLLNLVGLILSGVSALFLTAFYILPILFESQYVRLETTVKGYFDFHIHFTNLYQLFISRYWGYGASVFTPGLSVSAGQIHWVLPLLTLVILLLRRQVFQYRNFLVLLVSGWFALFLTHGKSLFIWEAVKPFAYIQFPWRFLAVAVFSFSLSVGILPVLFEKQRKILISILILVAIVLNVSFFREDIWYSIKDKDIFEGNRWIEQRAASIGDYWPIYGNAIPNQEAPQAPQNGELIAKGSNWARYRVKTDNDAEVELPIVYFPGWSAKINNTAAPMGSSGKYGLITVHAPPGVNIIDVKFSDTPVRDIGNKISLVSIGVLVFLILRLCVSHYLKKF